MLMSEGSFISEAGGLWVWRKQGVKPSRGDWILVLIASVFLSSFPSFLATMVLPACKLAGRDKGSMWDQLEDAAMETFSMSNHLSLCAVFIPPAWGLGPHLKAVGL